MASLLLRGFALGFVIAASPGPIFFLCLRRTLNRGWLYGMVSGLGVATADGVYGVVAAFGIAAVSAALVSQRRWLTLVGGIVLISLPHWGRVRVGVAGLRSLLQSPAARQELPPPAGEGQGGGFHLHAIRNGTRLAPAYLSTLGLTLANPATIIAFAAVFSSLGLALRGNDLSPAVLVAGVLLGSASWWLALASLASLLRARVTPAVVRGLSLFSGLAVTSFGLGAILAACSSTSSVTPSPSQTATPTAPQSPPRLTTYVAANFATALAWSPDGRLFYAERAGAIRVFDGRASRVFATVSTSTSGERGLLGLALSPTFSKDHFVYAFYSRADDLTRQRVVRWVDQGGSGSNLTTIIENLPAGPDCCHKGGRLAFGPDGKLYVTIGENHMAAQAQDPSSLRGKILRYNPDGSVPSDNPFGANNPVWAIGLRNPFGLAFSPDGKLLVTDNGPSGDAGTPGSGWDEVDVVVRGGNYQWPTCYGPGIHLQGSQCVGTPPAWQSGLEDVVPTGATFVSQQGPQGYQGDFVYCSYLESQLKVMSADGTRFLFNGPRCQLDVKEGPDHALYLSDITTIYRFGS